MFYDHSIVILSNQKNNVRYTIFFMNTFHDSFYEKTFLEKQKESLLLIFWLKLEQCILESRVASEPNKKQLNPSGKVKDGRVDRASRLLLCPHFASRHCCLPGLS